MTLRMGRRGVAAAGGGSSGVGDGGSYDSGGAFLDTSSIAVGGHRHRASGGCGITAWQAFPEKSGCARTNSISHLSVTIRVRPLCGSGLIGKAGSERLHERFFCPHFP